MIILSREVDCETCANNDSGLCDECEHNENLELHDHYVEARPEVIAEKKAKQILEREEALPCEYITTDLPGEFVNTFMKAKTFTDAERIRPDFSVVHAGEDYLIATDASIMARLNCWVPYSLRGMNIIRLEYGREGYLVRVYKGKDVFKDVGWDFFFNSEKGVGKTLLLGQIDIKDYPTDKVECAVKALEFPDIRILFQQEYMERALSVLTGEIRLTYASQYGPVAFSGDNGWVVVMPLRI
jgi:hypothetical protein